MAINRNEALLATAFREEAFLSRLASSGLLLNKRCVYHNLKDVHTTVSILCT